MYRSDSSVTNQLQLSSFNTPNGFVTPMASHQQTPNFNHGVSSMSTPIGSRSIKQDIQPTRSLYPARAYCKARTGSTKKVFGLRKEDCPVFQCSSSGVGSTGAQGAGAPPYLSYLTYLLHEVQNSQLGLIQQLDSLVTELAILAQLRTQYKGQLDVDISYKEQAHCESATSKSPLIFDINGKFP